MKVLNEDVGCFEQQLREPPPPPPPDQDPPGPRVCGAVVVDSFQAPRSDNTVCGSRPAGGAVNIYLEKLPE